jgi:hypothetical protein
VSDWCAAISMRLNIAKTRVMSYCRKTIRVTSINFAPAVFRTYMFSLIQNYIFTIKKKKK